MRFTTPCCAALQERIFSCGNGANVNLMSVGRTAEFLGGSSGADVEVLYTTKNAEFNTWSDVASRFRSDGPSNAIDGTFQVGFGACVQARPWLHPRSMHAIYTVHMVRWARQPKLFPTGCMPTGKAGPGRVAS